MTKQKSRLVNDISDVYSQNEEQECTKLWGSKRLIVAIFMFFGCFYTFMLRGNLSIAMVEMTSNKTIISGNETIFKEPEFNWDSQTKSWILSLYMYGSCLSVIGGYLSGKYGGVTVVGGGLLITALLTMLSPFAIWTNLYIFAVGRVAEGMFENLAYTGIFDVWSRWIPKNELPKVTSASHNGYYVGAAVTFPICGFIAQYFGWPMIFYFSGFIAVVWSLMLFKFLWNDPTQDKHISLGELNYIRRNTTTTERKLITYPWKKIIICKPLWALCCCKFTYSWAHFTMIFYFPLYIKDVTHQSTAIVGLVSGIPNYVNLFVAPMSGLFIGYLQNNCGFDSLKKSILAVCFVLGGLLFVAVGFSSFIVSMICFVLIGILLSTCYNIVQIAIVGLSPNHAGFIAGIGSYLFSLGSILGSEAVGLIVINRTWQEWSVCFATTGGLMVFTAAVVFLYGKFEDQKWSLKEDTRGKSKCKRGRVYDE